MCGDLWFEKFESIGDQVVQSLVLIAILYDKNLILQKESTLMKKYLLLSTENKTDEILRTFLRKKSLF